jgi:hypothetical protein
MCTNKLQQPGSNVSFFLTNPFCSSSSAPPWQQVAAFAPLTNVNRGRTSPLRMAEETSIPGPPYSGPAFKPILDSVKSPDDMKGLDMRQLKQVGCKIHLKESNSILIVLSSSPRFLAV